jgi:hypothetical protein
MRDLLRVLQSNRLLGFGALANRLVVPHHLEAIVVQVLLNQCPYLWLCWRRWIDYTCANVDMILIQVLLDIAPDLASMRSEQLGPALARYLIPIGRLDLDHSDKVVNQVDEDIESTTPPMSGTSHGRIQEYAVFDVNSSIFHLTCPIGLHPTVESFAALKNLRFHFVSVDCDDSD